MGWRSEMRTESWWCATAGKGDGSGMTGDCDKVEEWCGVKKQQRSSREVHMQVSGAVIQG